MAPFRQQEQTNLAQLHQKKRTAIASERPGLLEVLLRKDEPEEEDPNIVEAELVDEEEGRWVTTPKPATPIQHNHDGKVSRT